MSVPSFRAVAVPSQPFVAALAGCSVVVLGCRPAASTEVMRTEGESTEGVGAQLLPGVATLGTVLGVDAAGHLRRARATGSAGEVTTIPVLASGTGAGAGTEVSTQGRTVETVLLVGIGDGSPTSLLRAGAAACRASGSRGRVLVWLVPGGPAGPAESAGRAESAGKVVEGWGLAGYAVRKQSGQSGDQPTARRIDVVGAAEAVTRAATTVRAVHLARDLANTPANEKSPQWLAGQAVRRGARAGLNVRVWDERELAAEGFGGLVGVGQGSARPPRFVRLDHRPPGSSHRPHVVLVGKGIVFDSGGISIKPAGGMESMKTDMAGAAAVMAVMTALRELGVEVRVTGLLAIAENLPGDAALRPGDVIAPYGGRRTVEITNTDAEGRLVLADALAYADLVLRPDAIVDIATLTGAASLALGRLDAPLYATDEVLAAALLRASVESGERLWRMPLVDDYRPALESTTADLVNSVTDRGLGGGSIMAALFLREFAGGRSWAHLDIAGTGRADGAAHELSRGGTGFGVRLLLRLLTSWPTVSPAKVSPARVSPAKVSPAR